MSREVITLSSGVVSFRRAAVSTGAAATSPAGSASSVKSVPARGLPVAELKEIQRHAFERGQKFERDRIVGRIGELAVALERAREALDRSRAEERSALAAFGVEIALGVAAELVGDVVRDRAHDVRA